MSSSILPNVFRLLRQNRARLLAFTVFVLWVSSVVDVFTFMPKRAWYSLTRYRLSADEKLFEQWGGSHIISKTLRNEKLLGVTVGVPDTEYVETHELGAPYGQMNYQALAYPGRVLVIHTEDDMNRLKPDYLILDKNWPEFTFRNDPREPPSRSVPFPALIKVSYE